MEKTYLIDTNVIIDCLGAKYSDPVMNQISFIFEQRPQFSVISKIELLGFQTSKEIEKILSDFVNDSKIIGLNEDIVTICIHLRRKTKIKLPDAIIAATAIQTDKVLLTRNLSDFKGLMELKMEDPLSISF